MSTKEKAFYIFNQLTEEQLEAFVILFGKNFGFIPEEAPDEWDRVRAFFAGLAHPVHLIYDSCDLRRAYIRGSIERV